MEGKHFWQMLCNLLNKNFFLNNCKSKYLILYKSVQRKWSHQSVGSEWRWFGRPVIEISRRSGRSNLFWSVHETKKRGLQTLLAPSAPVGHRLQVGHLDRLRRSRRRPSKSKYMLQKLNYNYIKLKFIQHPCLCVFKCEYVKKEKLSGAMFWTLVCILKNNLLII